MSIYDDARNAIGGIGNANLTLNNLIAGHSDLAGLAALEGDVAGMMKLVDAAEAAVAPVPLVKGLFAEKMIQTLPSVVNVTCNVYWSQLQTTLNGPITANNPIDQAIASKLPFRVRLYFGQHSPAFAYTAAGGGVTVNDVQDSTAGSIPKWWVPGLQAAQADLITKLAAKYDGIISLIFMGTNATVYPEPFLRETGDPVSRANIKASGYTIAADKASYTACLDMFSAFKRTRLGWSFNPYQYVNPDGSAGNDVTFATTMMDTFRSRFGERAVFQNNSIRTPTLGKPGSPYGIMYDHMAGKKPLSFQTATVARVGDYAQTLDWALAQGAHAVELSPGFATLLSAGQLASYDKALRAN